MRSIIIVALLSIGLFSCSGEYHLTQAYKKGALDSTVVSTTDTLIAYKTDTVWKQFVLPNVVYKDTLFCDSNNIIQSVKGEIGGENGRLAVSGQQQQDGSLVITSECKEVRDSLEVIVNHNKQLIVNNKRTTKLNSDLKKTLEKAVHENEKWKTYFFILVGFVGLLIIIIVVLIVKHVLK